MTEVWGAWPTATCTGPRCGAAIWWAYTSRGHTMPVDPVPTATGNLLVTVEGDRLYVSVAKDTDNQDDLFGAPAPRRYLSHWATCPDAELFRPKKRR
jgi:hypothetical protein